MPQTKSAKKELRKNRRKRVLNLLAKKQLKDRIKTLLSFVAKKDIKKAKQTLKNAYQALDKAAKRGIIKKNAASRKKGRLTTMVNKLK